MSDARRIASPRGLRNYPRRRRAIEAIAATLPPVSTRRRGSSLELDLEGLVGQTENGKGIYATAIEAALLRNPGLTHVAVTINSAGGFVHEGEKIYRLLRDQSDTYITTIAGAVCASSASLILMAGELRQAESPKSRILIHTCSIDPTEHKAAGIRWTAKKHERVAIKLQRTNARILDIYAERCGQGHRKFFEREIATESEMPLQLAKIYNVIHCLVGEERWIAGRPYYS